MKLLNIKTTFIKALLFSSLAVLTSAASAEMLTGKLIGYGCASNGTTCPVDSLDPHINLEPDFVLQTSANQFYFLPNISRDTKIRHVLENIQVMGTKDTQYNTIRVSEFRVKKGSEFKTIWSKEINEKAREDFNSIIYSNR
jgi:hypothetical protein